MAEVYHALGLNMHQPLGNLLALHNSEERWEAKQILWCYDRPTRMIEGYEDLARIHMSFSGTLLKQFEDPAIRETFHDVVDIEDFLGRYRASTIEFVGTGLYHPVYPLIPPEDWDAQTEWWIGLGRHLLGRDRFQGFWPPEMGFCVEMIPMLKRCGYRYVMVDCWYIKPKREMRWEEIRYRPRIARCGASVDRIAAAEKGLGRDTQCERLLSAGEEGLRAKTARNPRSAGRAPGHPQGL